MTARAMAQPTDLPVGPNRRNDDPTGSRPVVRSIDEAGTSGALRCHRA